MIRLEKDLNKVKDHYHQHYYNEDISNKIKERVHQGMQRKKMSIARKIIYSGCAVAAAAALFVCAAFYSPSVASVAAKIPYLSMIFESKPVAEEIREVLTKKGYEFDGIGMRYRPEKLVTVDLMGTDEYVDKVTPEVRSIVEDVLKSRNFDAYRVEIDHARIETPVELTPQEKMEQEEYEQVYGIIEKVLKGYGHEHFAFWSNLNEKTYEFELPNTETRIDEIKQKAQTALDAQHLNRYTLKVRTFDVKKREREGRWMPIVTTIAEGTFGSKEYKVKGVAYTNKFADYMMIRITTSASSTDADYEEVVNRIESTILEFLESDKTKEVILDDAYQVIITSKDKKDYVIKSK
jgi:hypothetical protein